MDFQEPEGFFCHIQLEGQLAHQALQFSDPRLGRIFCVLAPGFEASDELAGEVSGAVGDDLGKAFRPDRVLFLPALPKTRSAKIVRRAVRARALGEDPGDLSSVENPGSLDDIARAVARREAGAAVE